MENLLEKFINSLHLTPFWFIVVVLLFLCLVYYDRFRVLFKDIFYLLARGFGCLRRRATRMKVEDTCSTSFSLLSKEAPELNLPKLRIHWVANNNSTIQLKDGESIVFLKYNRDNAQNIINATSAYVKESVLTVAKTYIPTKIKDAIDYTVIRKCLLDIPNSRYIVNEYIRTNQNTVEENFDEINKLCNIDDAGLMSRILFREYLDWGNRLVGRAVLTKYQQESEGFLNFLYDITSRGFDEQTKLQYITENIKVGVILVAKYNTFADMGELPYVRRIKEGFAKGIRTFYLLARNEKVDIVHEVYSKLIITGNYILLNGPKIYRDSQGRKNICYCIEVDKDGTMAKTYERINEAILSRTHIDAVITSIHSLEIKCQTNGIEVKIPYENITDVSDIILYNYFKVGMTVEFIPESVNDSGIVIGSFLHTSSNPKRMIDNKFSVKAEVIAIVEQVGDEYIKMRIKDTDTKAIAYRRNLTYSPYVFLHHIFPVGSEHKFSIIEIDYVTSTLNLRLSELCDPWESMTYSIGQELVCKVYRKTDHCILTEVEEGIRAILPFSETTWFDQDSNFTQMKLNSEFPCRIKSINKNDKLVILTTKALKSPYIEYYEELRNKDYILPVKVKSSDSIGIVCYTNDNYRVFIPKKETYIGTRNYSYKINSFTNVYIKGIAKNERSFIGSFKPFIEHPLQWFVERYDINAAIKKISINTINSKSVLFNIHCDKKHKYLGILPIGEITNLCYVDSLDNIYKSGFNPPLIISDIDMEQCIVKLSLRQLLEKNIDRVSWISYDKVYSGYVIGESSSNSIIVLDKIWVEGILVDSKRHSPGDKVMVRAISLRDVPEFTED